VFLVREYVKEKGCCDDIGLNSVVAYTTGKAPVWMKVPFLPKQTQSASGWAGKTCSCLSHPHAFHRVTLFVLQESLLNLDGPRREPQPFKVVYR
jgi:hypothetical protein